MKARGMKGYPVVALDDGSLLGRILDLAVNPAEKKVAGLFVGEKGLFKEKRQFIPYRQVQNIGKDVVIIRGKEGLIPEAGEGEQPQGELFKEHSFLGNSVISAEGDHIAKIQDFTFSAETGLIESLLLTDIRDMKKSNKNIYLEMEGVLKLGKDYVIASADYTSYLREEDGEEDREEEEAEEIKPPGEAKEPEGDEKTREEEPIKEKEPKIPPRDNLKEIFSRLEREISVSSRELARESLKKMKGYALHKKVNYDVRDNQGELLVKAGEKITEEVLQKAEAGNKIPALCLAVAAQELEEGLQIIKEKLKEIFG